MKYSNYHYNKHLKHFARALRKDATRAENRMWYDLLADKQFYGIRFYRQRAIGNYIADFFSKELKLVIEVDGFTHQHDHVAAKDEIKESELIKLGYHVIRFDDSEVLEQLDSVWRALELWLSEHYPDYLERDP